MLDKVLSPVTLSAYALCSRYCKTNFTFHSVGCTCRSIWKQAIYFCSGKITQQWRGVDSWRELSQSDWTKRRMTLPLCPILDCVMDGQVWKTAVLLICSKDLNAPCLHSLGKGLLLPCKQSLPCCLVEVRGSVAVCLTECSAWSMNRPRLKPLTT